MCALGIVKCSCWRGVSIWGLAVIAWVILGCPIPGDALGEVATLRKEPQIVFRVLPGCEEGAYRFARSRRFGGVSLEMSERELKGELAITSRRRSVAKRLNSKAPDPEEARV
jgi:hypothetical protein